MNINNYKTPVRVHIGFLKFFTQTLLVGYETVEAALIAT